jgi:hypothetical protein
MLTCDQARNAIALDPMSEDGVLAMHLAGCPRCVAYRRRHQRLDDTLRTELRWEPPAALSAQLLALAVMPAATRAVLRAPRPGSHPKEWYVKLVYLLTLAVIGVSLAVAWQVVGMLSAQIGLAAALASLAAAPGRALAEITRQLPEAQTALDLLARARDLAMWLLMVAILWRLAEQYRPGAGLGRRQTS